MYTQLVTKNFVAFIYKKEYVCMVQDKNNFHSGASWIGHPGSEEKIKTNN